jgi:hypothetical protein
MHPKIVGMTACAALLLAGSVTSWRLYVHAQAPDYPPPPPLPVPPQGDALLVHDAGTVSTSVPTTATVSIVTMPSVAANVYWGKKLLGKIAPGKGLVVVRPRDSGPLDLMVRASGYLPVQTRAHTFSDTRVLVKLTELGHENELLGYRAPLEAGVGDAGAAEAGTTEAGAPDASVFVDAGYFPPVAPPPAPMMMQPSPLVP